MSILKNITDNKRKEIEAAKKLVSVEDLKQSPFFARRCHSLKAALQGEGASGIIAEYKTASPSKGLINNTAEITEVVAGYVAAGASGISVLTDEKFFGGTIEDLAKARFAAKHTPILRKDFMLDEYQIYEAKAHGADVILLIAECLSGDEIALLAAKAHEIGLEVLLEFHHGEELNKISKDIDIVGINNRDLSTFEVDIEASIQLASQLPTDMIRISESGISETETVRYLRSKGFQGFLMGENFMKAEKPAEACREFIDRITNCELGNPVRKSH
ncbi:MAG: indole-3-glycerol phosphate synthase TrpC [Mangrovibacterium sp.]